jgi:hypothetical protein
MLRWTSIVIFYRIKRRRYWMRGMPPIQNPNRNPNRNRNRKEVRDDVV